MVGDVVVAVAVLNGGISGNGNGSGSASSSCSSSSISSRRRRSCDNGSFFTVLCVTNTKTIVGKRKKKKEERP